jgi:hypothetical protein
MGVFDDFRRSYRAGRAHGDGRGSSQPSPWLDDTSAAGHGLSPPSPWLDYATAQGSPLVAPFSDIFGVGREVPLPEEQAAGAGSQEPPGFAGDEQAEFKSVLAGYIEQNASLKATLEQWQAAVAERDARIGALVGELDLACVDHDHGKAEVNHLREQIGDLESIIAFPGVKNALRKATHPDTGAGGDVTSRTAIFQTLNAVLARLGLR